MSFNYRFEPPTHWDDDDQYFTCPYNHECTDCEYDCEEGDEE